MRQRWVVAGLVMGVLGTCWAADQRPGTNAEFGRVYRVGSEPPFQFVLKSAEYLVSRMSIGEGTYGAGQDQRLLVVRFSMQNTTQSEQALNAGCISFTAIDADNENHEYVPWLGFEKTQQVVETTLKPTQKVDCYAVVPVPGKGTVPKLIVLPYLERDPVLRFDLRGKVLGLKPPFVAEDDKSGMNVLDEWVGKIGEWMPAATFDLRVEGMGRADFKIPDVDLEEGMAYYVVALSIRYCGAETVGFNGSSLAAELTCDDGGTMGQRDQFLYVTNAPRVWDATLKQGQEIKVRIPFVVPKDCGVKDLKLRTNATGIDGKDSRSIVYTPPR